MDFIRQILTYSSDSPLLFTQMYFWVFFTILLLFYSLIYKKKKLRHAYLFLMSLFFYYKSGGYFFFLLVFSTIVDYAIGHAIYNSKKKTARQLFLVISIIINLSVLFYFKYAYFVIRWTNELFDTNLEVMNVLAKWSNDLTGSDFNINNILLPVGISFFTFQTISYSVDVYRKKIMPVNNILDFGFYVAFFPQLVAGPIVRAAHFIPQLHQKYSLSKEQMGYALFMILNGLAKKMIISDYISVNFVDRVFQSPINYTGFENLMALYGYSAQIYCDFSGYTDIAIGTALLLGFRLPVNFFFPYKSASITEFWRRWHISLSSWLRDYLYISLGGNRKGRFRANINIFITMLLGGLWHGASMRFVIWGAMHGIGLIVNKAWRSVSPWRSSTSKFRQFLNVFFTFHFVTFLWLFFRAKDMDNAWLMIERIINYFSFSTILQAIAGYKLVFSLILIAFIIHWLPSQTKENYRGLFIRTPIVVKIFIFLIAVFVIYQFKTAELQPFIYFRF